MSWPRAPRQVPVGGACRARRARATARALAALVLVATAGTALWWAGDALPPPGATPAAWPGWLEDRGPAAAALALARLLGLAAVGYVAVVGVLVVGLRAAGLPRAASTALRWAPPHLRRALAGAAGMVLVLPGATATAAPPRTPGGDVAVMRLLEAPTAPPPPPAEPAPPPGPPATPASSAAVDHVVQGGEHLWGIARQALARATGTPPTEAEILAYVEEVVRTNVHVLVLPDQPDLILPGQVFRLPAIPPAGPPPTSPPTPGP